MLDTLETLCCLAGVTGGEDEVRDYILERVMPHADEVRTDSMGNLLVFKKGAVTPSRRIMLCASGCSSGRTGSPASSASRPCT